MANKCLIRVETFDNADPDTITNSRVIDHNDPMHRRWFNGHTFWAMRNNHGFEVTPVSKEEA